MPRVARIKDNESVNYIIVKGITDVPLFRKEEDKLEYLSLLKRYRDIYGFKVYAYCVMRDYAHFIVDLCGADISSIMSSINVGYSGKYNRKYKRQGHLFHDRFKSRIVRDESELKSITLYIHNSPAQMDEYKYQPEKYEYSSLGAYMGFQDPFDLIDESFIDRFIGDKPEAKGEYMDLVSDYDAAKLITEVEINSKTSNSKYYAKDSAPQISPEEILDFISNHTGISRLRLTSRHAKDAKEQRALAAFIMKNLCHFKTIDICSVLDAGCATSISKLFYTGLKLVEENEVYYTLFNEFKKTYIV
jgi:REP element-mobilizing transposase RayT